MNFSQKNELVVFQENDDGTYSCEIKELGLRKTAPDMDSLHEWFIEHLEALNRSPEQRMEDMALLEEQIEKLQKRLATLWLMQDSPKPRVAGLLEQADFCRNACRILELEHPIEQYMGKAIKSIAFLPYKDLDADGDVDFGYVMFTHGRIGR